MLLTVEMDHQERAWIFCIWTAHCLVDQVDGFLGLMVLKVSRCESIEKSSEARLSFLDGDLGVLKGERGVAKAPIIGGQEGPCHRVVIDGLSGFFFQKTPKQQQRVAFLVACKQQHCQSNLATFDPFETLAQRHEIGRAHV